MRTIKHIAIIGLGGIGSHAMCALDELLKKPEQVVGLEAIKKITLADYDIIERKNLLYCRGVDIYSLGQNKATYFTRKLAGYDDATKVYGKPYQKPVTKEIRSVKDLENYDFICLCVDNQKTRNIVVESKKPFLDMRSTGRGVYVKLVKDKKDLEGYHTKDDGKKGGCQTEADINLRNIQVGNVVSASVGVQLLLNYIREDEGVNSFQYYL